MISVAFLLSGMPSAYASLIPVSNNSFESPGLANGAFTSGPASVPNWSGFPLSVIVMGAENPFSSRYAQTADIINDSDAHGRQYGYINTFAPGEVGSLTSDVVTLISPNIRYTLTVSLGRGLNIRPSQYTIELLANGVSVSSFILDGGTLTPGTFTPYSLVFDAPAVGPVINQPLQIRLVQSNITGVFQPIQGHYDNILLDASSLTSVPEPSATLLFLTAAIGLSSRSLRRILRRPTSIAASAGA